MRIETIRLAGRDASSSFFARAYYLPPFAAHAEWCNGEASPIPLPRCGSGEASFGFSVATVDGYRRFATVKASRANILAMLSDLAGSDLGAELAAVGEGKAAARGLYNRVQAWLGAWERYRLRL